MREKHRRTPYATGTDAIPNPVGLPQRGARWRRARITARGRLPASPARFCHNRPRTLLFAQRGCWPPAHEHRSHAPGRFALSLARPSRNAAETPSAIAPAPAPKKKEAAPKAAAKKAKTAARAAKKSAKPGKSKGKD